MMVDIQALCAEAETYAWLITENSGYRRQCSVTSNHERVWIVDDGKKEILLEATNLRQLRDRGNLRIFLESFNDHVRAIAKIITQQFDDGDVYIPVFLSNDMAVINERTGERFCEGETMRDFQDDFDKRWEEAFPGAVHRLGGDDDGT